MPPTLLTSFILSREVVSLLDGFAVGFRNRSGYYLSRSHLVRALAEGVLRNPQVVDYLQDAPSISKIGDHIGEMVASFPLKKAAKAAKTARRVSTKKAAPPTRQIIRRGREVTA